MEKEKYVLVEGSNLRIRTPDGETINLKELLVQFEKKIEKIISSSS